MLTNTVYSTTSLRTPHSNARNEASAIEKAFPRISGEICALWAGGEIDAYIDSLLLDDRGDRMGFPIEVLDELIFLAGIRWHLSHLCGTVIESTSPEAFSFTGNRSELCGTDPGSWVLL